MSEKINFEGIADFIKTAAHSDEYREFMLSLAKRIIDINNTPDQPLHQIAENENKVFDILKEAVGSFVDNKVSIELVPIDPKISEHPYYTNPYYTADEQHPNGLPADAVYKNRFNMFTIVNPQKELSKGKPVILNAHIDTVAPFFPCTIDDEYLRGRGACDDKGLVIMLTASMKILADAEKKFGAIPSQQRVYQFVIEEETGGNGSLSADTDERFAGWETIVCEATELIPHPANRGAMWFKLEMQTDETNTLDIIPFVILELTAEGRKLREETNLDLFPKEYVQVNLGTLNSFGRHPSAVNDYLAFNLSASKNLSADDIQKLIEIGVKKYCEIYGDKTNDELKQHYQLSQSADGFKLEIFGLGGHMSALLLRDNALTKAGFILSELIIGLAKRGIKLNITCDEKDFNPHKLELTGGVGFTPVHKMAALQERLKDAVRRGIKKHNEMLQANVADDIFKLTCDMLHNEAYASPADCPSMKAFRWAYCKKQMDFPKPIAFRASCDARIYANNGHNTITFGPGTLKDAHSDDEKLSIEQLQKGLELITLTTLSLITGEYESDCK